MVVYKALAKQASNWTQRVMRTAVLRGPKKTAKDRFKGKIHQEKKMVMVIIWLCDYIISLWTSNSLMMSVQ